MKIWDKIRYGFRNMMIGRNGVDRLSNALMWTGIGLLVLAMIFNSFILNALALAVYIYAVFRMFSRNVEKRSAENQAYVRKTNQIRTSITHAKNRFKQRKEFRYFKCPECKSWLRVPRGAGKVKVTCGHCKHQFSYIAK